MGNLFGGSKSSSVSLPQPVPIDINQVTTSAQNAARDNAYNSRALEAGIDPSLAKLRTQTSDTLLNNLNLGGTLPTDVQQMVQRAALAKGVGSGTSGSQFNRNLSARDLGLTSLDLQNQRLGQAVGYTNAIAQPTAGLDPGSIASLYVANTNTQNQFNAQNAAIQQQNANSKAAASGSLIGSLFGGLTSLALAPATGGGSLIGSLFQ